MRKSYTYKIFLSVILLLLVLVVGYPSYEQYLNYDVTNETETLFESNYQGCIDNAANCSVSAMEAIHSCEKSTSSSPNCNDIIDTTYAECLTSCENCFLNTGSENIKLCSSLLSNNESPKEWEISKKFKENFQATGIGESLLIGSGPAVGNSPSNITFATATVTISSFVTPVQNDTLAEETITPSLTASATATIAATNSPMTSESLSKSPTPFYTFVVASPSPIPTSNNSCGCENDNCQCKDTTTSCLNPEEFEKICAFKSDTKAAACARNGMGTDKDCTVFLSQSTCDLMGIDDIKELSQDCSGIVTKGLDDASLGRKLEEGKLCCLVKHEEAHTKDQRCVRDIPLVCAEDNTGYQTEVGCTNAITTELCNLYPASKACTNSCFHQLSKIIQDQYVSCHCKAKSQNASQNNPTPDDTEDPRVDVSQECKNECTDVQSFTQQGQLGQTCTDIFDKQYGGLEKILPIGCTAISNTFDPVYNSKEK